MYFDTHCHFDFSPFNQDLPFWLSELQKTQINKLCIPAVGPRNWQQVVDLVKQYPDQLTCGLGIHPCFIHPSQDEFEQLAVTVKLNRSSIVAIGETGLDGRQGDDAVQEALLEKHFTLATEHQLPVILHCVKRHHRLLPMLKRARLPKTGVIHAFTGDRALAKQYIDLGFKLGIGGALTWPSAEKLRQAVKYAPLESLVLETDAPDMPLSGMQKGHNTPLSVIDIFSEIIHLRNESTKTVKISLYQSSLDLFSLN